eukprot:scaffold1328_cov108-Cylindrotheca_fusiformis.AAC.5
MLKTSRCSVCFARVLENLADHPLIPEMDMVRAGGDDELQPKRYGYNKGSTNDNPGAVSESSSNLST